MSGSSGDNPSFVDFKAVNFLRLLPPQKSYGAEYADGVVVFLNSIENEDVYTCTLSKDDALRLAQDIQDHYAGRIDIENPDENYDR